MQHTQNDSRLIFVSGGVVSGIGKGVTTASLALLLKSRGFSVSPIKCDMYVNTDAGTMNPSQHGEVFVTDDGIETDQDLGTYERYLNIKLSKKNYTTTGQVYQSVIDKERSLEFKGRCVEVVPDIPEEIINRINQATQNAEFTIVEFGGTVGEYQTVLFLEASRILSKRLPNRSVHIHVSHFPFLQNLGELKSKPTQLSIRRLNECGIVPDFVVARSECKVDSPRFNTLCQNSNLTPDQVIFCPDVDSIYEVPLIFEEQKFAEKVLKYLGIDVVPRVDLKVWEKRFNILNDKNLPTVNIGILEKYRTVGEYTLSDTHVSVVEAIKHASIDNNCICKIKWIDAEELNNGNTSQLDDIDGLIIPQGWGERGSEGKIKAINYVRTNKIPFLGLCYGMQMAIVEFARHSGLKGANSSEIDQNSPHLVIDIMEEQKASIAKKKFGGTIRLGSYICKIVKGTKLHNIYSKDEISERHRHRYEFNNQYKDELSKAGLIFSGFSENGQLVEAIELEDHPFFIGVQYHPEFNSRFNQAHPLFSEFINACK